MFSDQVEQCEGTLFEVIAVAYGALGISNRDYRQAVVVTEL